MRQSRDGGRGQGVYMRLRVLFGAYAERSELLVAERGKRGKK